MQRIDIFLSGSDNARVGVLRNTCFLFPVHPPGGTAWRSASCTACAYCVWDLLISGRTGMARDLYRGSCHECPMASLVYGSRCLCKPRSGNVIPMKRPWGLKFQFHQANSGVACLKRNLAFRFYHNVDFFQRNSISQVGHKICFSIFNGCNSSVHAKRRV